MQKKTLQIHILPLNPSFRSSDYPVSILLRKNQHVKPALST